MGIHRDSLFLLTDEDVSFREGEIPTHSHTAGQWPSICFSATPAPHTSSQNSDITFKWILDPNALDSLRRFWWHLGTHFHCSSDEQSENRFRISKSGRKLNHRLTVLIIFCSGKYCTSISKYLLSAYSGHSTVLGTWGWGTAVNKTNKYPST